MIDLSLPAKTVLKILLQLNDGIIAADVAGYFVRNVYLWEHCINMDSHPTCYLALDALAPTYI